AVRLRALGEMEVAHSAAGGEGDPYPEAAAGRRLDVAAVVAQGADRGAARVPDRPRLAGLAAARGKRWATREARRARAAALGVDEGQGLGQHLQQLLLGPLPRCPETALKGAGAFALLAVQRLCGIELQHFLQVSEPEIDRLRLGDRLRQRRAGGLLADG